MKRLLVTGASGLVGRQLLPLLVDAGYEVHAVSRRRVDIAGTAAWHGVDLLSPGAGEALVREVQPEGLIHLAWEAGPGTSNDEVNREWLEASRELISTFHESGGKRVLVAGTCFEYDWSDGLCVEDRTPLDPVTLYGRCKLELSRFLEAREAGDGESWVWPRMFFLYGPHEHPKRLVASVARSILDGKEARCTHGRQVRDYLHSRDAAEGIRALFESPVSGPVNLASGERTTVGAIAGKTAELLGRPDLLALGAIPAPEVEPPVIVGSREKITAEVSWEPRIALENGLAETIEFWRKEGACL